MKKLILILFLGLASGASAVPSFWSFGDLLDYMVIGGHIASGTGSLPTVASEGARYTDLSDPLAPKDYRSNGSSWVLISGGGSDNHADLSSLGFEASGHTGFSSEASVSTAIAEASSAWSLSNTVYNLATATKTDLDAHKATQVDPHGATETITEWIQLGSGTPDVSIFRLATGVVEIASYVVLVPEIATPTSPATGTLWMDLSESPPKMKCFDGTDWQPLW